MIHQHVSIGRVLIILLLQASLLSVPVNSSTSNTTNVTMGRLKNLWSRPTVLQGRTQIEIDFENKSSIPMHLHHPGQQFDNVLEDLLKVDVIFEVVELLKAANQNEDTNSIADERKKFIEKLKFAYLISETSMNTIANPNVKHVSKRDQPDYQIKHQSDTTAGGNNFSTILPGVDKDHYLEGVEVSNPSSSPVAVANPGSEATIPLEAAIQNKESRFEPDVSIRDEAFLQSFETILAERPEPKVTKFKVEKHELPKKEISDEPVARAFDLGDLHGNQHKPKRKQSFLDINLSSVEDIILQAKHSAKHVTEKIDPGSGDSFTSRMEEDTSESSESGDKQRRKKRSLFSYFFDDEEPVKEVPDLIRSQGYPTEVHKVVTADGYILELHRIPGPKFRHKFRRTKGRKKFRNFFGKRSVDNPGESHLQDADFDTDDGWIPDENSQNHELLRKLNENLQFGGAATPVPPPVVQYEQPQDEIQNKSSHSSASVIVEKLKAVKVMLDENMPNSPLNFNNDHLDSLLGMFTSNSRPSQNKSVIVPNSTFTEYLVDDFESQKLSKNNSTSILENSSSNVTHLTPSNKPKREARIDHYYARLGPPGPIGVTSNHLLPLVVHQALYSNWGRRRPIVVKIQPRRPHDRTWPYRRRPGYPRPAVLIHHGLFASSANFVLSDANGGALAYLLADAGYDVWLANWRGNSYSRGHIDLDPDQPEFWDFSLDEIIRFDIPAVIDYVINTSGQRRLFFIGHSLGCAMFFGATNHRPDLSRKVRLMIAMAPAAFMDNSQGILKSTILSMKSYYQVVDWLGVPDVPIPIPWRTQLATNFCGPATVFRLPCFVLLDSFMGKVRTEPQEYYTRVLLSHFPGTVASTRIMAHFGQFVDSGGMHRFNFGADENYRRYGQSTPPRYDLDTVTCPVAVMWGPGDTVITPEDVSQCVHMLPNVILNYRVPDSSFNHLDFIFPEQAEDIVYRPIMALLARY